MRDGTPAAPTAPRPPTHHGHLIQPLEAGLPAAAQPHQQHGHGPHQHRHEEADDHHHSGVGFGGGLCCGERWVPRYPAAPTWVPVSPPHLLPARSTRQERGSTKYPTEVDGERFGAVQGDRSLPPLGHTAPQPRERGGSRGDGNPRQHPTAPEHIQSPYTAREGTAGRALRSPPNPTPWGSPRLPAPSSRAVLELRAEAVPGAELAVGTAELGVGVGRPGEDGAGAVPEDHVWLGTVVRLDGADVGGVLDGAVVSGAELDAVGRGGVPAGPDGGSAVAAFGVAVEDGVAEVCGGDRGAAELSLPGVVSHDDVCGSAVPELREGVLCAHVVTASDEPGRGCDGVDPSPWTVPKERAEQQGWGRARGAAAPPSSFSRCFCHALRETVPLPTPHAALGRAGGGSEAAAAFGSAVLG